MVMGFLPESSPVALIVPLRAAMKAWMPEPDPIPSPRHSMMHRFWRMLRLLALLSIVIAAIAVALVMRGARQPHHRDCARDRDDGPGRNRADGAHVHQQFERPR